MDRGAPSVDRRLLMQVAVRNRAGQVSERFIDADSFELWRIAMRERHGIRVVDQRTVLWLPEAEYARHAQLFEQRGGGRAVTRLRLSHFDGRTHRTHHVERFVPRGDVDVAVPRLAAHLWDADAQHTELARSHGRTVGTAAALSSLHAA